MLDGHLRNYRLEGTILGDLVGRISTLHLTIADQSEKGSFDSRCLDLAEMASHAVDFTKSGVPVNRSRLPRADSKLRPDFLSFPGDDFEKDTYSSNKALGHMFRAVPVGIYAVEIGYILSFHDL